MANIAIFDQNATPQKITAYLESQNTPDYAGRPDVLINPDLSVIAGFPMKHWKHVAGAIQLMTQAERDAVDAAIAAELLSAQRNGAKNVFDSAEREGKILKAVVLLLIDELNDLRTRDRDRAVDVAAATNLADLKTRWAARSSLTNRTAAQARTAIRNKIDGGDAD